MSVEALYTRRAMVLSAAARAGMQAWLDANPPGRHGRHDYRLDDYGIELDEVRELFGDYAQRHGLAIGSPADQH